MRSRAIGMRASGSSKGRDDEITISFHIHILPKRLVLKKAPC